MVGAPGHASKAGRAYVFGAQTTPTTPTPPTTSTTGPLAPHTPAVLSVSATPTTLPTGGGTVVVAGRVRDAATCQLQLLSQQSFPVIYSHNPKPCTSGSYSASITIGANPSAVRRTVAFALVARNGTSASSGRFYIVLSSPPPTTTTTKPPSTTTTTNPSLPTPSITLTLQNDTVPLTGGTVKFDMSISGLPGSECTANIHDSLFRL